jgi:Sulfotransferase domain
MSISKGDPIRNPRNDARPRCWGIGLGRTGTTSLCEALRILGYVAVGHNPQFEELRSLNGGADNGVTLYYKYLDYKFPDSKFVLTTRALEDWLSSMAYITEQRPLLSREEDVVIYRRMTLYETVTFDRDRFVQAYRRHHADVRRYFRNRPNDLLEMSVVAGDGWEKLCPFLRLPIPRVPFPLLHRRQ